MAEVTNPPNPDFGWIDYSDPQAGTQTSLPVNVSTQIVRDLTVPLGNSDLGGPFANFAFWDNTTHTLRARALRDRYLFSIYLAVVPGAIGGTLDVTLMAGTVDLGTKAFPLTEGIGQVQGIRAEFPIRVRSSFFTNGAMVLVKPSVAATLQEFSPEVFPLWAAA